MKKTIKKIRCFVFGHKYILKREITPKIRELKCKRCLKEFGMSDEAKVVIPLDPEIEFIHDLLKK